MFPSVERLCVDKRGDLVTSPNIIDWFRDSVSFENLTELVVRDFAVHEPEIARSIAKMTRLTEVAFLNGRDPTVDEESHEALLWGVLSRLPIRTLIYTGSYLMPRYMGGLAQLTVLLLRDVVHDDFAGLEIALAALSMLRVFEADAYEINNASIAALGRLLRLQHLHLGYDVVSPTDWTSPFRVPSRRVDLENQSTEGCFASLKTLELFGKDSSYYGYESDMNEPTETHRWILRAASRNAMNLGRVRLEFPYSRRYHDSASMPSVERAILRVGRDVSWLRDWTSLRDLKIHLSPNTMDTLMPALARAGGRLQTLELYNCTNVVSKLTPKHAWPLLAGVTSVVLHFDMVYTGCVEYSRFIAYFVDFPKLQKFAIRTISYGLPYARKILEDLGGDQRFAVEVTATVGYDSPFEDVPAGTADSDTTDSDVYSDI